MNGAIEETAGTAMRFGDRLCDAIGNEAATSFFEFVLRTAASGLIAKQSQSLIRDRVIAELRGKFTNEERRLLRVAADHAALVFEIAVLLRDGVLRQYDGDGDFRRFPDRARGLEHDADQLVIAVRQAVRRRPDYAPLQRLLEIADDAADELEDVVFLLGLLSPGIDRRCLDGLHALADVVVSASQEWVKVTADAAAPEGGEPDDFLVAVDRLAALEHEADDLERELTRIALAYAADFRQLHLTAAIGRALEASSDALKAAALMLHDSRFVPAAR